MGDVDSVKELFRSADTDGNGEISRAEMEGVFRSLGGTWTDEMLETLFDGADVNSDGVLMYEEFLEWVFQSGENLQLAVDGAGGGDEQRPGLQLAQAVVSSLTKGEGGEVEVGEELAAALGIPVPEAPMVPAELVDAIVASSSEARLFEYWCANRRRIKMDGNLAIGRQIAAESEFEWAGPSMMITGAGCDAKKWISLPDQEACTVTLTFAVPATISELFIVWGEYTTVKDLSVRVTDFDTGEQSVACAWGSVVGGEAEPAAAPKGLSVSYAAFDGGPLPNVRTLEIEVATCDGAYVTITDLVVHGDAPRPPEPEPVVECDCSEALEEFRAGVPQELFRELSPYEDGAFQDPAPALSGKSILLSDGIAAVEAINALCEEAGGMFADADFPAGPESVMGDGAGELGDAARGEGFEQAGPDCWRRVRDFAPEARLFVGGVDMNDVMQGAVGDCWLISVIASLACVPKHVKQLIYPQEVSKYGAYAVRLFSAVRSEWLWVVVDDRIPLGPSRRPYFMSAQDPNELWPVLLEKAFAKVSSCYAGLSPAVACGGTCSMTMVSGSSDVLSWAGKAFEGSDGGEHDVDMVWDAVVAACDAGCAAACGVADENWGKHTNAEMDAVGVVYNHVFSCVGYRQLEDGARLLRLRNPWGEGGEWRGPWSDGSAEWTEERKAEVPEHAARDDGAFFISIQDFYRYWYRLEICRLQPMVSLADLARGKVDEE
mmetsp:Transcript_75016/g.223574  ORF Transcript_75016/g.223574 Transcript_75016/m.223574 type:complete len:718 (-) Transcript_75016:50-2203(-)